MQKLIHGTDLDPSLPQSFFVRQLAIRMDYSHNYEAEAAAASLFQ